LFVIVPFSNRVLTPPDFSNLRARFVCFTMELLSFGFKEK
jgi:hypothetical protein